MLNRTLRAGRFLPLVLALAWTTSALAQDQQEIEGTILSLDDGELVVDLGSTRGAAEGDVVELWRPLRVKHPVTGKVIVDRFRIGTLRLGQVRKNLAMARAEGAPSRPPAAGDVVVLHKAKPLASRVAAPTPAARDGQTPPGASASASASAPATSAASDDKKTDDAASPDPESRELTRIFDALRGADPVARVRAYEAYVREKPKGRYAVVLYEEAQALRRLLAAADAPAASRAKPSVVAFAPPEEVRERTPLRIALDLKGASGAVLHVRSQKEVAYVSVPMTATGAGYFSADVPVDKVTPPGVAYFVEATLPDGTAHAVLGTAAAPRTTEVEATPAAAPRRADSSAAIWADYAFYNSPSKGNDRVFQTEGIFATRFSDEGVRALRSGFGVYRGASGSLSELDDPVAPRAPRKVGLTYGYLELEYGFSPTTSFIGRAVLGLRDEGVGGGGQTFVRIGNDRRTNLMIGGELLGGIGLRGIVQLEWRTIPRVPILLRTEVTNQPAGDGSAKSTNASDAAADLSRGAPATGSSDVGARAIVQVGYQLTPSLELDLRGSYQGRTINHAGPGFGAGVTYSWLREPAPRRPRRSSPRRSSPSPRSPV